MAAATATTATFAAYAGKAGTVYGDGSAGNYTAPGGETTLDVSNPQFNNFTVPAGRTLHVPSGLTIRCANTFTNAGTIIVDPAGGGTINIDSNYFPIVSDVTRGIAKTAPYKVGVGRLGRGGRAVVANQVKAIFSVASEGGGTGFPSFDPSIRPSIFALGGGALHVLVQGALTNTGTIHALGQNGEPAIFNDTQSREAGGGSGGGVVILASATSLTQSGEVNVAGGIGGADAGYGVSAFGPGGGGGGGLIRLLSPVIVSSGQNIVSKGAKQQRLPGERQYNSGGGGGASAGDGAGYSESGALEDAADGMVLIDQCSPTALLGN